jgi:hypothetical protein
VFQYPVVPAARTAVLGRRFRPSRIIRVFPDGWCAEAAEFRPAALAGTREQLTGLLGTRIPSLTHALIVVLKPGERRVSEAERERFWRAFGVPLFEQVIEPSGRVLATECEAHEGLHIEAEGFVMEDHSLDESPCGCGSKTPRLRLAGRPELERAAAYAR